MLTIMIVMMLLKLLYDGIGVFYSQVIVSAKNPYTAYREALAAASDGKNKSDAGKDGGEANELA